MHVKYEVSISYGSKVIAKVKVDDTDKQTDRQDMVPTDNDRPFSRTFQGLLGFIFKDFSRTFHSSFDYGFTQKTAILTIQLGYVFFVAPAKHCCASEAKPH